MIMKALDEKIQIEEQVLEKFERKWFSVIEWGWNYSWLIKIKHE